MTAMQIRVGNWKYQAVVGSKLLEKGGLRIRKVLRGPHCAIISDSNVAPLFGDRVRQCLTSSGFQPALITIPAGETSKTLEQVGAICDQMIAAGLDRQSFVIGLGGGMVGDISGFVAAIYERGIPHVQIPTTLLGMVDSSIGGKTGVNARDGKNLIGAVHHPSLVIDDLDQTGERALLNFGHTVGHAIERAGDYREFLHGEAVSLGIVAACAISIKKAGLPRDQRDAVIDLLSVFELPTRLPANFSCEKIFEALPFDKKFERGKVRFVVTPEIGSARLSSDVTMEDIREAIDQL